MGFIEILIIAAASIFVIFVIVKSIIDKKHGKTTCQYCDGSCSGCHQFKKTEAYLKKEYLDKKSA